MATTKKIIDFTYDGVKYKSIEALTYNDGVSYDVGVTGTAKMIRQYIDTKYPKFAGRGILWVKSRKFANGDSIDVYFNRIPDDYKFKINTELEMYRYNTINTSLGSISIGTKYLDIKNQPPYDSAEKNEPAPDWEKILKNSSPTTSGGRSSGRSNFEWGELIKECAGWKLYVKAYKDTFVYNLVKDKETPQNRESWGEIQGEITTKTGFKWTKKTQTFSKWGLITDVYELTKILCQILLYYYNPKPDSTPTPQPEPTPEPTPTSSRKFKVGDKFRIVDDVDIIYEVNSIKNNNIYLNFTTAGGDIIKNFEWIDEINAKNEYLDKGRIEFIDEPAQATSDRETIENQIKALNLVLKYASTDEDKRITETQIKALNITLKYI